MTDDTVTLRAALDEAAAIIETGDQRLLASDGSAGGQPPDINLAEWRRLYRAIQRALALAAPIPGASAHPDAGNPNRNHYDWFMPSSDHPDPFGATTPTEATDRFLDDFEAKMTKALTDPFVHDMAQSVLPLIAAYRAVRLSKRLREAGERVRSVWSWPPALSLAASWQTRARNTLKAFQMSHENAPATPRMDDKRLAQKVRWEGGLEGALDYGIRIEDIEDPKTAVMWADLAAAYEEFTKYRDAIAERLGLSDG